jgi:antitoxin CptB
MAAEIIARVAARARAFYMRLPMADPRLEKLRYRAWRRGFREADLVLGGFADARLATMSAGELEAFETLLDQVDHDLWSWIAGQAEAPPAFQGPLLEQIRAFRFTLPGPHGDTTRA